MKIIKRNGVEATFDISKIVNAINKANAEVSKRDKLTDKQITDIAEDIEKQCKKMKHAPNVEDIQDIVENHIMALQAYNLARKYITYRYEQSSERKLSDLDKKVLSLIECDNEEIKQENSNKNSTICSVQRDYMAGEISKELTKKVLLPKDIIEAHEQGIIHFHDADYFASHIHNCFHSKTRFITSDGIKSFADCHDGQIVEVMDKDGFFRTATVKKYGKQQMFKITFKTSQRTKEVICTRNHRWILKDGTVTTNVQINDTLYGKDEWFVKDIALYTEEDDRICDAWCVEEPVTHSFMLEDGMVTGNCDLVNLEDMLQNGTVISGTKIEKPHSFSTACNIATQIIAQVASSQYGLK